MWFKHKLILMTIIVFCASASSFAETVISGLPFNCNTAGETYTLSSNLSANGTAITVSANNVTINGNGRTITYGNTTSGSGIILGGNVSNLNIHHVRLVQGTQGTSAFDNRNYSPNGLKITDSEIIATNNAAVAIRIYDYSQNLSALDISRNIIQLVPKNGAEGDGIGFNGQSGTTISGSIGYNTITIGGTLSVSRPACVNIDSSNGSMDIHHNTMTISGPDDNNVVIFWNAGGHKVRDNTITMNCYHCRGILIDGGSDNNEIARNKIDMNTSGSSSGIRIRYGSDNNQVYDNDVNSEDASSGYCLRLGERQNSTPSDYPNGNRFRTNLFKGISPVVRIENGSDDTIFQCNKVTSTNSGYCVDLIVWSAVVPNTISNLSFLNESYTTGGNYKVHISSQESQKSEFSNISWCNSGVSQSDISNSQGIGGWSIASATACASTSCTVSPEPEPPTPPPIETPQNLRILGSVCN